MKQFLRRLLVISVFVLAVNTPVFLQNSRLRVNYSDSSPLGLYRIEASVADTSYAGICLNAKTLRLALAAGLDLGKGECPDGHRPILKMLYRATSAMPVQLDEMGFMITGQRIANSAPKTSSKKGRALRHYPFGSYSSGLWAISRYSRDSYDSRYFGPVAQEDVLFYAVPVFVF